MSWLFRKSLSGSKGYQQGISLVLPEQGGQVFSHDHGELMTMLVRSGSLLLLQSLSPA